MFPGKRLLPDRETSHISRIEISNFKSIERIEFDIPNTALESEHKWPAFALLGENAAGKSSVLEAIALALAGRDALAALNLDGRDFLRRDQNWNLTGDPAEVRVFLGYDNLVTLRIDPRTGELQGPEKAQVVLAGYGPHRFLSESRRARRRGPLGERIRSLFHREFAISNPTGWLMNCPTRDFDAAIRAIREVLLLEDDDLVSRPLRGHRKGAKLLLERASVTAPLDRMSEGYRAAFAMAADIIVELLEFYPNAEQAHGVVLIDEIDAHLHPRWKMQILRRLRKAMPQVQFIVTTHDPLCLRGLDDGEVAVLQRDDAGMLHATTELPKISALTTEQLLTSDYFGLLSANDALMEKNLARYVALISMAQRSEADEAELSDLRSKTVHQMRFGATPQDQLIYEASNAFLARERAASPELREDIRTEARARLADLLASLNGPRPRR